eukprot:UN05761
MADYKDDEKKKQMHQIPITNRKPMELYRLLPTVHSVTARSKQWVMMPGLQQTIKVTQDCVDVIITVHGHGKVQTTAARLDVGIFIDGKQVGIDGYNKGTVQWSKNHGTAITHSTTWSPVVSFACISVPKRNEDYVIDRRIMNQINNLEASNCNGTAMFIQVFKPQPIVEWIGIDLDDELYFNKDLEYKIEIKAKTTAYAITVNKENLWFFYVDANPGIKCIKYKNKG